MDIEEAVHSHKQWKLMVESLFREEREFQVSPSVLHKDNLCKLGQWIYSDDSNNFKDNHYFEVLRIAHRNFHSQAATILTLYENNQAAEAEEKLSKFQETSETVINLLKSLKKQMDTLATK